MKITKKVMVAMLVLILCMSGGITDDFATKSKAKESGREEYIQDAQGLEYRFPRDDEADIEDTNSWAVSLGHCKKKNIVIPDTFKGKKVTYVDWSGFLDCDNLTSITFGKNIKGIHDFAFKNCKKLTKVKFKGEKVTYIGEESFSECISLKEIDLPKNLKWISSSAFFASGLEKIVIPKSVETIYSYAFADCTRLKRVIIKNGVKELWEKSFAGCDDLKAIVIPKSIEVIQKETFSGCSQLKRVTFKGKVKKMDSSAFYKTPFYKKQKNSISREITSV